jgi:hypothetical protein
LAGDPLVEAKDSALTIMLIRALMDTCNEFRVGDLSTSFTDISSDPTAALGLMCQSDEEAARRMTETAPTLFDIAKRSRAGGTDSDSIICNILSP